ncbi:MAG: signal peptide peptidase SppA [Planctomycetota bacterium]
MTTTRTRTTILATLLAALAAAATTGCIPRSFTINLDSPKGPVREATVQGNPRDPDKVALIDLVGVIGSGGLLGGAAIDIDDTALMLREAEQDPAVKAIVLRIDSPGGGVGDSHTIYQLIRDAKDRSNKPVIAAMDSVAASGGYYIALAADTIIAKPTTVTGSVGVIIPAINASQGLESIGIVSRSITSGDNKDLASPAAPVNPEHEAILQAVVDDFYEQFRTLVVANRPNLEDPDATLDGRILTGRQALDAGLVDQLGNINDAFQTAKDRAGLDLAQLVKYHRSSQTPATPYASVQANTPNPLSALDRLPRITRSPGPGVYYLWLQPAALASP